jgi:isocitrate lyase
MNILINIHMYIHIYVYIYINSHVWMETPDANVQDARQFMDLVNEHLAPHGLFARYKCVYTYVCVQIRIYI